MDTALTKPKPTSDKSLGVKLDASQQDRLRAFSAYKNRTPHFLMKEAIEWYLQKLQAEKDLLDRLDASADHYERTGLHLRQDEVKDWAASLSTAVKAPMPVCHG